jgi:ABC-type dipeptide/oligopeptide/nickel transport system permease component
MKKAIDKSNSYLAGNSSRLLRNLKITSLIAFLIGFIGNILIIGNFLDQIIYYYVLFILAVYLILCRLAFSDYEPTLIASLQRLPYSTDMNADIAAFATSNLIYIGPFIFLLGLISFLLTYRQFKVSVFAGPSSNHLLRILSKKFTAQHPLQSLILLIGGFISFFSVSVATGVSLAIPLLIIGFFIFYDFLKELANLFAMFIKRVYRIVDSQLTGEKKSSARAMAVENIPTKTENIERVVKSEHLYSVGETKLREKLKAKRTSTGSIALGLAVGLLIVLFYNSNQLFVSLIMLICFFLPALGKLAFLLFSVFADPKVVKYAFRRIFGIVPLFFGCSILVYFFLTLAGNPIDFIVSQLPPGGSRDTIRRVLTDLFGLNQPVPVQWANYIFHLLMGDMGISITTAQPVLVILSGRFFPTLELSILPLIFSVLLALPLGAKAAKKQYSTVDNGISFFSILGLSIPIFFFLVLFIGVFSLVLAWLPSLGNKVASVYALPVRLLYIQLWLRFFPAPTENNIVFELYDHLAHLIIPVVALTLLELALFVRLVRSGMLEEIQKDYVLSARASGFSESIVTRRAIRNVLIPLATFIGLTIGVALGGAPVTETVLSWPGLGSYATDSILKLDYTPVMGTTLLVALLIMLANLATDIIYSLIDPRIHLE